MFPISTTFIFIIISAYTRIERFAQLHGKWFSHVLEREGHDHTAEFQQKVHDAVDIHRTQGRTQGPFT